MFAAVGGDLLICTSLADHGADPNAKESKHVISSSDVLVQRIISLILNFFFSVISQVGRP